MASIIAFPKGCYSTGCMFSFKRENLVRCGYSGAKVTHGKPCPLAKDLRSLDSNFIPSKLFERARFARDSAKKLSNYE